MRAPGIEPGPNPWQGLVLPLNHARMSTSGIIHKKTKKKIKILNYYQFLFERWAYGIVAEHRIRIAETAVRFRLGPPDTIYNNISFLPV